MAITVTDVKSPAGDVDGAIWFPSLASGAVDTLLTGYITDAYTHTDDDDAAELWVYYRAASAVADRMTVDPASVTRNLDAQGTKTKQTLEAQIQYWIDKATAYLARFEVANTEDTEDDVDGWSVLTSLRH